MGITAPVYHTAEMVRSTPTDGQRLEVVHGELLATPVPRPWHQVIQSRMQAELALYLRREPIGHLLASPADISWGPDTLVQPDLFVVPLREIRTLEWDAMKTLILAVEILGPSSTRADRFTKRRLYQEIGIPWYWMVDGDRHVIEVWTPDATLPVVEHDRLTWSPKGSAAPFDLEVSTLFRPL